MNTGYKGKKYEIFAYNGGLFAPDKILDNISIDDEILHKHTLTLSNYDFETDVDVNILGHIFEHSLGEIEQLQGSILAENQATKNITLTSTNGLIKASTDGFTHRQRSKTISKRKKDGIFYTPKYITKYIVENTVGKLCEEKRQELDIIDEDYAKGRKNRQKDRIKALDDKLTDYRNWLLNITILDPACGSGAFLNQALDFLISEHQKIDNLRAQLLEEGLVFADITSDILENNIYGVDINEESVEIAKLSLWLRTAQKGRKLNTLNNNIKCGNSLIDDQEVAGEKAFNWQNEFPEIFKEKEIQEDLHAYHITWAVYNSRPVGINNIASPMILDDRSRNQIAEYLDEKIGKEGFRVTALNILKDHVHCIIICPEKNLSKIVGQLKGYSSHQFHKSTELINHRVNPMVDKPQYSDGTVKKLWAKDFSHTFLNDEAHLANALHYIEHNHLKHSDIKLEYKFKNLTPLADAFKPRTEKGGFDVVIGNPPYVHLEKIKETSIALKNAGYETYHSQGDIYCVFVEKGINVLKPNGIISYIMPNKWLQAGYGKPLREYFLKYKMFELIDFGDIQIFEGATTYPCIFISQKAEPEKEISISVLKESNSIDFKFNVLETAEKFETKSFNGETWVITSKIEKSFLENLQKRCVKLSDFINGEAYYGIKSGLSEAFLINEETKQNIINEDSKAIDKIKPFLQGRDLTKYNTVIPTNYLLLFEKGITNSIIESPSEAENWFHSNYPSIANWLMPFEQKAKKRTDKGDYWWELRACDYYNKFSEPKIMYQKFQVKPCFIYDKQGLYCNDSMWIIPTDNKALLGFLNSKMGWWLITKYCTQIQNGCQLIWKYFGQIPVPELDSSELTELVEKMLSLTQKQQTTTFTFIKYLNSQFTIEKLSRKLENWHELEFSEFIKELNKTIKISNGKKLSKSDEMEWMELFETKKFEAQTLKTEIDKTDKEIDQKVYELYGLTEEEIRIVEESV